MALKSVSIAFMTSSFGTDWRGMLKIENFVGWYGGVGLIVFKFKFAAAWVFILPQIIAASTASYTKTTKKIPEFHAEMFFVS